MMVGFATMPSSGEFPWFSASSFRNKVMPERGVIVPDDRFGRFSHQPAGPAWLPCRAARASADEDIGGIFIFLMLIIAGLVVHDNRESTENTAYIAASGEMRMLSQRLAKASTLALQGNPLAFTQLKESRATFAKLYEQLANGGEFGGQDFSFA
jgi:hypothetical protein